MLSDGEVGVRVIVLRWYDDVVSCNECSEGNE